MTPSRPEGAVELAPGAWVEPGRLLYSFSRAGGPGGQAVNKLSTRAELRVAVTAIGGLSEGARDRLRGLAGRRLTQGDEIVLAAETSRSQLDNRQACLERLRALVAEALPEPKRRKRTRPSRAAVERRLAEKRRQGEKKEARRRPEKE